MKYFYFTGLFISLCLLLISFFLNSLLSDRKLQLESYSSSLSNEFNIHKSQIGSLISDLAGDQILISGVNDNLTNTYSSQLKNIVRSQLLDTNIAIFNEKCEVFYHVKTDDPLNICLKGQLDQITWVDDLDAKLLVISKNLGMDHIITVSYRFDIDYFYALAKSINVDYLKVLLNNIPYNPDYHHNIYLNTSQSMYLNNSKYLGDLITYVQDFSPRVYDNHPIAKYFKDQILIFSDKKFPENSFLFIVLAAVLTFMLLIFLYYYGMLIKYKDKLSLYNKFIVSEIIALDPKKDPKKQIFSLEFLINSYKNRLKKSRLVNADHRKSIDYLKNSLESLHKQMSQLALYKALIWEVERNANLINKQSQIQDDIVTSIDDQIKLLYQIYSADLSNVLSRWQKDINSMGYRKFLRTYLEVQSTSDSNVSLFASDVDIMIDGSEKIRNLISSIGRDCNSFIDKKKNFKSLISHWSALFSEQIDSIDLYTLINHTMWQIRQNNNISVEMQMTHCVELNAKLPKSFVQMMRCILYESIFSVINRKCHNSIYWQYLSEPIPRVLISVQYFSSNNLNNITSSDKNLQLIDDQALTKLKQRISLIGKDYSIRFERHRSSYNVDGVCYSLSWQDLDLHELQSQKKPNTNLSSYKTYDLYHKSNNYAQGKD